MYVLMNNIRILESNKIIYYNEKLYKHARRVNIGLTTTRDGQLLSRAFVFSVIFCGCTLVIDEAIHYE